MKMTAEEVMAKVFAATKKKYGDTSISKLGENRSAMISGVIPTGIEALDKFGLGCGGWPLGRMSEVFGPESAGKSSLVASSIAGVQRVGGNAFLGDVERAFTADRAKSFGARVDEVGSLDPADLQTFGNMLVDALKALPNDGPPALFIEDSVPALITKEELKGDPGDEYMGIRARFYSKLCTYLVQELPRKNAHMLFVNQIRMKIGVMFGNPETTPGGNAIKFYSTHRIRMSGGKKLDGARETFIKVVKNKLAEPGRTVETQLLFGGGWDDRWTTVNHAKEQKVIPTGMPTSDKAHREAREALGWGASDAALALGAPPAEAAKVVPPRKRKGAKGKE